MLNESNKKFIIRNFKIDNTNKIYLEIIYGNDSIIRDFKRYHIKLNNKFKNNPALLRILGLNSKLFDLDQIKFK